MNSHKSFNIDLAVMMLISIMISDVPAQADSAVSAVSAWCHRFF